MVFPESGWFKVRATFLLLNSYTQLSSQRSCVIEMLQSFYSHLESRKNRRGETKIMHVLKVISGRSACARVLKSIEPREWVDRYFESKSTLSDYHRTNLLRVIHFEERYPSFFIRTLPSFPRIYLA